jgi:hypothetical protein
MDFALIKDRCADLLFATKRRVLGPDRVRRTRLYCVGIGKTGTHSIATMFTRNVRSAHEPERLELAEKILARHDQRISEQEMAKWILERDRRLALEVDSSFLNIDLLPILLHKFPDARFLLTIRDCYTWCNSIINEMVRSADRIKPVLKEMASSRYQPHLFKYAPEEQLLKEKGLYTLAGYFAYWAKHNSTILNTVPPERLLVVRTDQIGKSAFEIANFAGLPRRAVRVERTHEYRNPAKQDIIRQIDRNFLQAKVEEHCQPLMTRFFPEIRSLADVDL